MAGPSERNEGCPGPGRLWQLLGGRILDGTPRARGALPVGPDLFHAADRGMHAESPAVRRQRRLRWGHGRVGHGLRCQGRLGHSRGHAVHSEQWQVPDGDAVECGLGGGSTQPPQHTIACHGLVRRNHSRRGRGEVRHDGLAEVAGEQGRAPLAGVVRAGACCSLRGCRRRLVDVQLWSPGHDADRARRARDQSRCRAHRVWRRRTSQVLADPEFLGYRMGGARLHQIASPRHGGGEQALRLG
mmetsp:Transcript_78003/g.196056  ORF Transcript_78003/g.196056 Transcript_78003/m.196056 type:complete len:243 (-) Transcript_78003:214-942(-)